MNSNFCEKVTTWESIKTAIPSDGKKVSGDQIAVQT
jgi:hypothetical protein